MKFHCPLPPGEPFPGETLRADGWEYRDLPGLVTPEQWTELLRIIGEENYRILGTTTGFKDGAAFVHGQLFVSPYGLKRMAAYAKGTGPGGVH